MKTFIILIFCFALISCASVDITKTAKGSYNPTNPNELEILMTRPDKPFIELGTVTVHGYDSGDVAEMHNAVRAKAAPLGADAVILTSTGLTPAAFGAAKMWATGVAIKYKSNVESSEGASPR